MLRGTIKNNSSEQGSGGQHAFLVLSHPFSKRNPLWLLS